MTTSLPDIARSIAAMTDDDSLETLVAQMSHSQLTQFLAGAEAIRKLAAQAVKFAESRVVGEQVLAIGEMVEFNGKELVWTTDHKRECSDPEQLRQLLHEQSREWNSTLAKRALLAAFKYQEPKVYMTELDRITKWEPMAEPLVKDWVSWKDSAPHLRPVTPDGE